MQQPWRSSGDKHYHYSISRLDHHWQWCFDVDKGKLPSLCAFDSAQVLPDLRLEPDPKVLKSPVFQLSTEENPSKPKYSAILFFVWLIAFWKETEASMPMDCIPNIVEVRIYFGNGKLSAPSSKSRASVFKNLAAIIRDTAKINYLRGEKWYLSGTETSLRSHKFAIISIPDSIPDILGPPSKLSKNRHF